MSARNFYIMQSAVAPMQSELPCYTPLTNHRTEVHTVPLVMAADYAALEAERDALRQQRDKLAKVLEDVEREHDLIRRMKNCEIHRGRGSFGIAVMSDPPALEWQALDKELQQFVDARRAALAAGAGQEV